MQLANRKQLVRVCTTVMVIALVMPNAGVLKAEDQIPYQLAPGKVMGYALKIQINKANSTEFIGGVACFWGIRGKSFVVAAQSRDNVQKVKSETALQFRFPTDSKMLRENFAVNKYGEPLTGLNGQLPMLLGDLEELFFPPLPKEGHLRLMTHDAYHMGDGKFRFYGSPEVDEGYKGEFMWSTTYVGKRSNVLHYVHRRKFATKDNRYQLQAQGPIEFDAATGKLLTHKLQGSCVHDGKPANFSVSVVKLGRNQLTKLISSTTQSVP